MELEFKYYEILNLLKENEKNGISYIELENLKLINLTKELVETGFVESMAINIENRQPIYFFITQSGIEYLNLLIREQ